MLLFDCLIDLLSLISDIRLLDLLVVCQSLISQ